MNYRKVKWKCKECGHIGISDPFEHHKMDYCPCGKTGMDLETYSCRMMGDIEIVKKIPFNFKEERLKKCWTTYGKNGEFPEGKIISVSEMDGGHLKAILETQEPSEKMKLLIKREIKKRIKDEKSI